MIKITLPDGEIQEYKDTTTGIEIAENIGPKLLKDSIAIEINDILYDLSYQISSDANIRIITKNDPDALHILRHSSAHVLAQAVLNLYPDSKYGTGPSTDDGFYYDFMFSDPISDKEMVKIEEEMMNIINEGQTFDKEQYILDEAKSMFKNQKYKLELIDTADQSEGVVDKYVSVYSNNKFSDLCLGPHVPDTSYIKHFKLLRIAGAYWRGNESNDQLQRIYGTSWFSKKELDMFMNQREEALKRDHRKLGKELDLFISPDELGPGQFIWTSKGAIVRDNIENFSKEKHNENGYDLVYTPHIGMSELWETSGHLNYYKEAMYPPMQSEDGNEYYLKPMNCPFHILNYKSSIRSYRDLPIRYFEFGSVYRYEKTGVLHGLLRARGFTQDDAHIFCTTEQLDIELKSLLKFSTGILNSFGFDDIEADLSTKPTKAIGDEQIWDHATDSLKSSLVSMDIPYKIAPGEGAFYGPKIDLHVKDAIGRRWQLTTIQVDFAQPENFGLEYVSNENKKEKPVMIHRALLGSVERFTGILIEHYSGLFPGWLSPTQVVIISLNDNVNKYSKKIINKVKKYRFHHDNTNARLSEKIKKYKLQKVPVLIVIGENDMNNETIAINFSDGQNLQDVPIKDGIKSINDYLKIPDLNI